MNKLVKSIVLSFIIGILFFIASAQYNPVNAANYTRIYFRNTNPTTWQVWVEYRNANGSVRGTYTRWPYVTYADGTKMSSLIFNRIPTRGEKFKWLTACVDPIVRTDVNLSAYEVTSGNSYYDTTVNISCRDIVNQVYAGCGTNGDSRNFGNVRWNAFCPTNTIYCTKGGVTQYPSSCNPNPRCGSGSTVCDRIANYCNPTTGRCAVEVRNTNVSTCVGRNGCCLSNSDCSGGDYFCGTGSNACTRYRNVCSNNRCTVNTVNTESRICAGERYASCLSDSECNSSSFCRNPNPCGFCTEYDQIRGRVFIDVNRNNKWDGGSTDSTRGMGNKTVERSPSGANNWRSTTTESNGQYSFLRLRNPSNQDVRIIPNQFGLYDSNHCTYTNIIRSSYQGNVQSSPGHRRNNIDPTPNLTGVHFMLRSKSYAIGGTVYEDTNNNGVIDVGTDRRFRRWLTEDVIVRVNDAATGAFVARDSLYKDSSGYNDSRDGNYWIPGLVDGKTYDITLNNPTVANVADGSWYVVGSNRINGVTINCSNNGGNNFLVASGTPPPGQPDLSIDSFIIPDGNPGDTVTARVDVTNEGTDATGVSFNIRLRHNNLTQTINISAAALNSNETDTYTRTITLPATEGTYNADLFVDSGNSVTESNEGNNTASTTYEVLPPGVTPPPPPPPTAPPGGTPPPTPTPIPPPPPSVDLDITSFNVSDGIPGSPTSGTITLVNSGSSDILGTFTVNINNGSGNSINFNDGPLLAGESTAPISFNISTPATAGTYTATATVDSTNVVVETNETNNTATTNYLAIDLPDIEGGVFLDSIDGSQNSDGIKTAGEEYTTGTFSISGLGTFESLAGSGFTAQDVDIIPYTITFDAANDLPQGWEMTYPLGVIPPNPFVINVTPGSVLLGAICSTGTHENAICDPDGNILELNFGIRQIPASPWFNGIGGDMRSDNPLENRIPEAANTYFSDTGPNSSAGIVFGDSLTLNPLTTNATNITNPDNWLVERDFEGIIKTSYASVVENLRKGGNLPSSTLPGGNVNPGNVSVPGVYSYTSDITLTGGNFNFINGNYLILVNGDLRIENDITVAQGSTAIFIANGNITVIPTVQGIQGIFSANQSFTVEGEGGGTRDEQLIIEGSVIGLGGTFENQRDLLIGNEDTPAIQIIYRPDFVLFAPELMRFSNYTIREVAPGAE